MFHAQHIGIGDDGIFTTTFNKGNGSADFGCHTALSKLTIFKMFFCFCDGHAVQGFLLRGIVIDAHLGHIGEDKQFIGPDLYGQQ